MTLEHRTTSRFLSATLLATGVLALTIVSPTNAATASSRPTSAALCVIADDAAIADLFRRWNIALASLDSARVAALYWPDAVLLPTVSNLPRTDPAAVKDYFVHFLQKFPRGQIVQRIVHHGCNISVDAGLYDFSVMDPTGNASLVTARYTFVYTYRDGLWKIQHHHSSAMPETVTATTPHASSPPTPAPSLPTTAVIGDDQSASVSASATTRNRIQLASAPRTPTAYLTLEQRRRVGRETVGLKVCATGKESEPSFEISDAAPFPEANEAALSWARAARWSTIGDPSANAPLCAQVVVRFTDAGT